MVIVKMLLHLYSEVMKLHQKGIANSGLFLALLVILVAGFSGWRVYEASVKPKLAKVNQSPESEIEQAHTTSVPNGFSEYQNTELSFRFVYPKTWGDVVSHTQTPVAGKDVYLTFSNNEKGSIEAASHDYKGNPAGYPCSSPVNSPSATKPDITKSDQNVSFSNTVIKPIESATDYLINKKFINDGCQGSYNYLSGVHVIDSKTYAVYVIYNVNLEHLVSNSEYAADEFQFISKQEEADFTTLVKSIAPIQ